MSRKPSKKSCKKQEARSKEQLKELSQVEAIVEASNNMYIRESFSIKYSEKDCRRYHEKQMMRRPSPSRRPPFKLRRGHASLMMILSSPLFTKLEALVGATIKASRRSCCIDCRNRPDQLPPAETRPRTKRYQQALPKQYKWTEVGQLFG